MQKGGTAAGAGKGKRVAGRSRNTGGGDTFYGGGGAGGSGVGGSTGTNARVVSAGVLNGPISLPKPAYAPIAKAARVAGQVSVQVIIDESGKVISATAVGGNPLFHAAAVAAARQATFTPKMLSGKPVKVAAAIVYQFDPANQTPTTSAMVMGEESVARLLEEQKRLELESKLHSSLLALVDRSKDKNAKPGVDEVKFVRDGKAEIQVWLTDKSEATIAQLKQLGFEVILDPRSAKMVVGRVPIEKLATLAELNIVQYVAPLKSK
jgi:TonB family protein